MILYEDRRSVSWKNRLKVEGFVTNAYFGESFFSKKGERIVESIWKWAGAYRPTSKGYGNILVYHIE
jgi:hypothetical protein